MSRPRSARAMINESLIESARAKVASLAGAKPETVIFTSGGSEANALALAAMNDGWLVAPGGLFSPHQGSSTFMRINVARTSDVFLKWLADYLDESCRARHGIS